MDSAGHENGDTIEQTVRECKARPEHVEETQAVRVCADSDIAQLPLDTLFYRTLFADTWSG